MRRPSPLLRRVAALVLAVTLLSACRLDVGVDVVVADDGSGVVTVTAVADAELLARAPGALADLRVDDLTAAGWTVEGPTAADGGAQRLTATKPFTSPEHAARVLAELSGPGGPLHDATVEWERTFGTVRTGFGATARLDGGIGALGDAELVTALAGKVGLSDRVQGDVGEGLKLTVTARGPGEVTASNGTVSADRASVSWTPDLRAGGEAALEATFTQRDDEALSARTRGRLARIGLAVWAALMVALIIAITVYVTSHRRRPPRRR